MIPKDIVDTVLNIADIVEVVSDFVQLKKSGSSYRGLSPFTNEKTPSFYVVPTKGIFKDFSSGKGGGVIQFLEEHEKMTFPEAIRYLAQKYNIEIQEEQPSEEAMQERSERESLQAVNEWAANWFEEQLWKGEEGRAVGYSYFRQRGFREDIIKKFRLGYCNESWDSMSQAAKAAGYEEQWLKASGLSKEGKNGKLWDFFKGRVMFPILDVSGRVVAFGGRTLQTEKKIAKYFNSPESALYNKSRVLYGIYQAKNEVVKNERCFLVEGYTDVISLHQAGVENVVASSGTALTEDQVRLIKRYTENITILYDGDPAGIRASFRGIDIILAQGLNVKVVLFPDGEDPDSYAQRVSSQELQRYLNEEAKDFIRFKTDILAKDAGSDPIKRAEMIREVVLSVAEIPDGIKRQVYIQECANILSVDEQVLINETNKVLRNKLKRRNKPGDYLPEPEHIPLPQPKDEPADEKVDSRAQEVDLIRLLLHYANLPVKVKIHNLEEDEEVETEITVGEYLMFELYHEGLQMHDPTLQRVAQIYAEAISNNVFPELSELINNPDRKVAEVCADLLTERYEVSENWSNFHDIYPDREDLNLDKAVKDCIYKLKIKHVMRLSETISEELKNPQLPEERLINLLEEKRHLDQIKSELARYFGSTIL
jgi:DNA primase